MKILLVGGLGFLGKHIIRRLVGSGNSLTIISDAECAQQNQAFIRRHGLHVEIADIQDANMLKEIVEREKPDAVVHLAALTGLVKCSENASLAFSVNVFGTYNVIMACVASKSRLIFMSSREVYGETTSVTSREDDPLIPNNIYGLTKLLGERILMWAASRYGLDYVVLRLTNLYGPEGEQYNIQAIIRKALTDGRVRLLGGSQVMNLIYVEDAAEATLRCLMNPQVSREVLNVGSRENFTVEDVVTRVVSMLDSSIIIDREPMREIGRAHV
jgi:nucleoside-diphosphate-sugar epimerase